MKATRSEILGLLANAQSTIRVLGVVPLDADWESLAKHWIAKLRPPATLRVSILCESDNALFSKSLTSDTENAKTRRSFSELQFMRDRISELDDTLFEIGVTPGKKAKGGLAAPSPLDIATIHLDLPFSVVEVDGKMFASLWLGELQSDYEEIAKTHPWRSMISNYLDTYFADSIGRKYSSVKGEEIIDLYDHNRVSRGVYPRASFYDTDYSQLVVWALIFDRQGRLLIHRRSENAHDNRNMWDKSVGGHFDFTKDLDTSRAAFREVIEELFSDESDQKKSVDIDAWATNDRDIIYMGEWRPEQRKRHPFREIAGFRKEWAAFRLDDSFSLYSPRQLEDGTIRRLRVIADVFLFVANPHLADDALSGLKNSPFKLVELAALKNVMDKAMAGGQVPDFDRTQVIPLFTPDLTNIMTGRLRGTLEEFSQYIKRYLGAVR